MKKLSLGFRPSDTQRKLYESRTFYNIFGGARGGGKTHGLRSKSIMLCGEFEGYRVLIIRQSFPELEKNYITPMKKILARHATYNGTEKTFTFRNGSTISFMYCSCDADLNKLQGAEYDALMIDEATNMTEYQLRELFVIVRGVNPFPKRVYMSCNPGGPGHSYIKRIAIDRQFLNDENPDDYTFIQSLVTDNYVLLKYMPRYVENLDALPARRKAAWRFGDWNVYEGQFFDTFTDDPAHYDDWQFTHVINPFPNGPPREWGAIYRSYDEGYDKPFSVGWWVVSPDGVLFRILELYGCTDQPNEGLHWTNDEVFARIAEIERTHPWLMNREIHGVADPSCWKGSDRGISSMDMAARHGLYFKKGENARIPGWYQMRYRMQFDKNGYAKMYVFNTCKAFIRTIRLQMFDLKHPDDLDSNLEDHVMDESRYMCMSRPITPDLPEAPADIRINPLSTGRNTIRRRA